MHCYISSPSVLLEPTPTAFCALHVTNFCHHRQQWPPRCQIQCSFSVLIQTSQEHLTESITISFLKLFFSLALRQDTFLFLLLPYSFSVSVYGSFSSSWYSRSQAWAASLIQLHSTNDHSQCVDSQYNV